jgi:hypothetical protein
MRMIISMKMINCNNWAPRNKLNISILIRVYSQFYHRLISALHILYKDNALNEDDYFYEDN